MRPDHAEDRQRGAGDAGADPGQGRAAAGRVLYLRLRELPEERHLHADETTLQVLREPGKKAQTKSYMWLYLTGRDGGPPIVLYEYQPNRKAEHAEKFLEGFSGYLHADGYQYYLKEQWPYLARYLEDGRLELSNNRAERSIKPFVIGRKNFLFANTPLGARGSAVVYSLIETAKETGLDPYRYLLWVLSEAPKLAQTGDGWAERLTPANAPADCHIQTLN